MEKPPKLPAQLNNVFLASSDFVSEFGEVLETIVLSTDQGGAVVAVKTPQKPWEFIPVSTESLKKFRRLVDQSGFWIMEQAAEPGSLGGGAWRLEVKFSSKNHTVFRVNPGMSAQEKPFVAIIHELRSMTK